MHVQDILLHYQRRIKALSYSVSYMTDKSLALGLQFTFNSICWWSLLVLISLSGFRINLQQTVNARSLCQMSNWYQLLWFSVSCLVTVCVWSHLSRNPSERQSSVECGSPNSFCTIETLSRFKKVIIEPDLWQSKFWMCFHRATIFCMLLSWR